MSLERLPVELLAIILNGRNAWAAIELWKSGSPLMRQKLCNGGVTDVKLETNGSSPSPGVWPRCLKHFRLSSLTVSHYSTLKDPVNIHSELKQLNRGLRNLDLRFKGALVAFFGTSALLHLQASISPSAGSTPSSTAPWNWNDTFPELERLNVLNRDDILHNKLNHFLFGLLPRSLTSLSIPSYQQESHMDTSRWTDFSQMPPNLTKLSLPAASIGIEGLPNLPSRLVDIGDSICYGALMANLALVEKILPNLESFPLEASAVEYDDISLPKKVLEGTAKWPKSLLDLEIELTSFQSVLPLPTKLSRLWILGSEEKLLIGPSEIMALPSSLSALFMNVVDWKKLENPTIWPSALTSMDFSIKPQQSALQVFCNLPRGLKSLSVHRWGHLLREGDEEAIPNDLKTSDALLAQGRSALDMYEKEHWNTLRTELIQHGERNEGRDRDAMATLILEVERGSLHGLPLSLKALSMSDGVQKIFIDTILPPQVRKLEIADPRPLSNFRFLSRALPPFLSRIKIGSIYFRQLAQNTITGTIPTVVLPEDSGEKSPLFNLPLSKFEFYWLPVIEPELLCTSLPRHLRTLRLMAPFVIPTIEFWRSLPPTIEQLWLECSALKQIDGWTAELPRQLTDLSVTGPYIGPCEWHSLPPQLYRLQCVLRQLQPKDLLSTPRSLSYAGVGGDAVWTRLQRAFVPFWRICNASEVEIASIMYKEA